MLKGCAFLQGISRPGIAAVLLLLAGLCIASPVMADGFVEDDLQQWTLVTLTLPLTEDDQWRGYLEVQPRIGANLTEMSTLVVRTAVSYKLGEHARVSQGFGWAPTFQPDFNSESRIFQQLELTHKIKKLEVSNRTRLEQRWIAGVGGTAVRGRHMVRLALPLDEAEKWRLIGSDELFIHLNDARSGPQAGFDQNRAFLGINRRLNERLSIEAGYFNNLIDRRTPLSNRMNHAIFLGINTTL